MILLGVLPIFDVTKKKMKAGANKKVASSSCPVFSHAQKLSRNGTLNALLEKVMGGHDIMGSDPRR